MAALPEHDGSRVKSPGLHINDRDIDISNEFDEKLDLTGSKLNEIARGGAEAERDLTTLEAIKIYPMAIFWAVMVGMCVVMEGYDTILIKNFYAYPSFVKKYGTLTPDNGYQFSAQWQAGLGNSAYVDVSHLETFPEQTGSCWNTIF